jgi:hypothetical protein
VFLQEHFVLAVLYVQLRACPVGVYGRAFLDFRQMFGATKKAPSADKFGDGRDWPIFRQCLLFYYFGLVSTVPFGSSSILLTPPGTDR